MRILHWVVSILTALAAAVIGAENKYVAKPNATDEEKAQIRELKITYFQEQATLLLQDLAASEVVPAWLIEIFIKLITVGRTLPGMLVDIANYHRLFPHNGQPAEYPMVVP